VKIRCVGGGPAALYFSLLAKKAHPHWDVQLFERNPANVTWGFGVVFSDETMESFREADAPSYQAISDAFVHWDDIHIFFKGEKFVSTGHGFAGMQRLRLLQIIEARAREVGVGIYPLDPYYERPPRRPAFVVGYGSVKPADIRAGVAKLASVLD